MNAVELLWRSLCREDPEEVALAGPGGELCFGDLIVRIGNLASYLDALGIRPGDRIGILSRNCIEYPIAYWSLACTGAVAVPMNFRLRARELKELVKHSRPSAWFVEADLSELLYDADPGVRERPVIAWGRGRSSKEVAGALDFDSACASSGGAFPTPSVGEEHPFAIVYTGGTTGNPKGVVRTHGNVIGNALFRAGHSIVGGRRSMMCVTPLFHVAGQGAMCGWLTGGRIVVSSGRFDAEAFLGAVEKFGVESVFIVPTMLLALSEVVDPQRFHLGSLREWRSGSAPLSMNVADRIVKMYPTVELGNGAGSTEAGNIGVVWYGDMRVRAPGCVGRTAPGQEVRIFDGEGHVLPPRAIGEVVVRGPQVGSGYWREPERSREVYDGNWLHTGDVGWMDEDGMLFLADRRSDLIISGGENIYPAEVEEVIFGVEGVRDVAVFGRPDARWGETVVAVVVGHQSSALEAAIRARCKDSLATYKCPRQIEFVPELPKTAAGKVDKRRLRDVVANWNGKAEG